MEQLVVGIISDVVVRKLGGAIMDGKKLRRDLKYDLEALKLDLAMMKAFIIDLERNHRGRREMMMVSTEWLRQTRELTYEIEDCLDLHTDTGGSVVASPDGGDPALLFLGGLIRRAKTALDPRSSTGFADEIKRFRKRVHEKAEMLNNTGYAADGGAPPASGRTTTCDTYASEHDLVGIDKPKKEVLDLLQLQPLPLMEEPPPLEARNGGGHQQEVLPKPKPKPINVNVVSIVGPRGLGKSTLARVVFDFLDHDEWFDSRAWVRASECMDGNDLLAQILLRVRQPSVPEATTRDEEPGPTLRRYLQSKRRYFIVIDDLQLHDWEAIKSAFPGGDVCGRILVTTSVKKIANLCSSERGTVYKMQTLCKDLSRELFMNKLFKSLEQCPFDLRSAVDSIVDKCDGLPLALVSIAQHLKSIPELTEDRIMCVSTDLGQYLLEEGNPALERMKQALKRTYDSLPSHDLKECLLSVSIFPKDYPIKKKSLVRRWLAEGLVARANNDAVGRGKEKKAQEYLEELIDRNVIQPVDSSSSSNAMVKKICHIHGVMLDFIVQKSISENFTVIPRDAVDLGTANGGKVTHRLSLQNINPKTAASAMKVDLSHVRSLAIFKHEGDHLLKLLKLHRCKLLRALDLQFCKGLQDGLLNNICKLLQLKYLSLRGTDVSKLPKKMYKLLSLETLDIRDTKITVLPMGVLTLPALAHLFGRFALPSKLMSSKSSVTGKLHKFFEESSQLQTLAGFAMDDQSPRFMEHFMSHMRKLSKVKLWRCATPPGSAPANHNNLVSPLKVQFNQSMKSLSVDFGDDPISFLYNIDGAATSCYCKSIKLRGKLCGKLPDFILSLDTLRELCLISFDL